MKIKVTTYKSIPKHRQGRPADPEIERLKLALLELEHPTVLHLSDISVQTIRNLVSQVNHFRTSQHKLHCKALISIPKNIWIWEGSQEFNHCFE